MSVFKIICSFPKFKFSVLRDAISSFILDPSIWALLRFHSDRLIFQHRPYKFQHTSKSTKILSGQYCSSLSHIFPNSTRNCRLKRQLSLKDALFCLFCLSWFYLPFPSHSNLQIIPYLNKIRITRATTIEYLPIEVCLQKKIALIVSCLALTALSSYLYYSIVNQELKLDLFFILFCQSYL